MFWTRGNADLAVDDLQRAYFEAPRPAVLTHGWESMSRARSFAVFAAAAGTILGLAVPTGASPRDGMDVQAAPNPAGIVPARDAHGGSRGGGGGSANMLWHNGPIMTDSVVKAIYWGKSWSGSDPKILGMDSWYTGFSGSRYAQTSDEYTGTNGQVGPTVAYGGHIVDNSKASGGSSTSTILTEVGAVLAANGIQPVTDGYYPVYVDLPRSGNYCAWHSWGTLQGVQVQFAFFWNLDGDAGCDPQSTVTNNQGLAALANVSGHELSEARTDPQGTGWYDRQGAENGDKCAWTFAAPYVTFTNGTQWKIQGEWSNSAYNAGSGYPNSSGQKGCLQGA